MAFTRPAAHRLTWIWRTRDDICPGPVEQPRRRKDEGAETQSDDDCTSRWASAIAAHITSGTGTAPPRQLGTITMPAPLSPARSKGASSPAPSKVFVGRPPSNAQRRKSNRGKPSEVRSSPKSPHQLPQPAPAPQGTVFTVGHSGSLPDDCLSGRCKATRGRWSTTHRSIPVTNAWPRYRP